uniref:Uncharacterized protein MANES_16G119000 n=1 Tax=Rhizophora mucronata TaxID=61149 RepID=A0A2P2KYR1_RHIMU
MCSFASQFFLGSRNDCKNDDILPANLVSPQLTTRF